MGNVIYKILGYILVRYIIFFIILVFYKNVKWNWSNLKGGEDWFYFGWLFFVPVIIEIFVFGLPMGYGLNKLSNSNKGYIYVLFLVLFVIEFLFTNWLYGTQSAFIKTGISVVLFLILFWKRLF